MTSPNSKLAQLVTTAWQRQAIWVWLLLPLSWLYGMIIWVRRRLYHHGILPQYHAPIPVMIIGNITVGGSGKTPLIIALVKLLQDKGIQVGVISRGYGGDISVMPCVVRANSQPNQVGDEPCEIVRATRVPMAVGAKRDRAIQCLLTAFPDLQILLCDDGLQHYALYRDIEWCVVDSVRGLGNRQLLPTGFLREPMSRLQDCTVIYHIAPPATSSDTYCNEAQTSLNARNAGWDANNNEDSQAQLTMWLATGKVLPLCDADWWLTRGAQDKVKQHLEGVSDFYTLGHDSDRILSAPATVYGVTGIGYPKRFFTSLSRLGFAVIEHAFADHHAYCWEDLAQFTDHPIVTTQKDAVKLIALFEQLLADQADHQNFYPNLDPKLVIALASNVWVLPVEAVLSKDATKTFLNQVTQLVVTN